MGEMDDRIKEDVCARLAAEEGRVDASDVEVRVERGEVTLQGSVPTPDERRRVEAIADDCEGVRNVHNRLNVRDGELGVHQL